MSEEKKEVEITKESIIKEYRASREYIDEMNAEKGRWGDSYKTDKLPGLLEEARKDERDKVTLELQPEETETDKRLKALEQSNAEKDKVIALSSMKEILSGKAKEIGFDISRSGRYSAYGDNAEKFMIEDHEYMTTQIASEIEKKIKGSVDSSDPHTSETPDTDDFNKKMGDVVNKL